MSMRVSEHAERTVAARFDPRNNSVNALRLGLALLVLVSHTVQLSTGGPDALGRLTGNGVDLSTGAVDGFFALSGFLISASYLSSPSVSRYLWRRALRILPAFWTCLVVTSVLIAPLAWFLDYGSLAGYPVVGDDSATSYVTHNAGLLIREFHIAGAFAGEAVNGSLHTLFYESVCYLLVAVAGVLGVLGRRPRLMLAAWLAVLALITVELVLEPDLVVGHAARELMLRHGTMFLAGACLRLFSDRIRFTAPGGLLAVAVLAAALSVDASVADESRSWLVYTLIAPAAVAYLIVLVGSSPRLAAVGSRRDLSYGLYVYAWPVQATLLVIGAASWWIPLYLCAALAISLALALASWTFVEAPALSLKSWTPRALDTRQRTTHR